MAHLEEPAGSPISDPCISLVPELQNPHQTRIIFWEPHHFIRHHPGEVMPPWTSSNSLLGPTHEPPRVTDSHALSVLQTSMRRNTRPTGRTPP